MTTLGKLTELIDSLPEGSVTRANLKGVRGAIEAGPSDEYRLYEFIREFCQQRATEIRHAKAKAQGH